MKRLCLFLYITCILFSLRGVAQNLSGSGTEVQQFFVHIRAQGKQERTRLVNRYGIDITFMRSDYVGVIVSSAVLKKMKRDHAPLLGIYDLNILQRHSSDELMSDFPAKDKKFHNYQQVNQTLRFLASQAANMAKLVLLGKSIEKRKIFALHLNTDSKALQRGKSNKPGVVFVGTHHAREHVSTEFPLMFAAFLIKHRNSAPIKKLLKTRDIWIVPLLNPDGAEWDIHDGTYHYWRKNRRHNADGTYGVDLNRNYGYHWGESGTSTDTSSDVYRGPKGFSEPETQIVKTFIKKHTNIRFLVSFHTFSELVLYPWGYSYQAISNKKDHRVFQKVAKKMASWNHYRPMQASELYLASGVTMDWAYGKHHVFAFTFELSPSSMWAGGFYPGEGVLKKVFQDNLKPCLYLLELADNPYKVLAMPQIPYGELLSQSLVRVP